MMATNNILIHDSEIKHGVLTDENPAQAGFKYADSWTDYKGMGISVIGALEVHTDRARIFMDDNLDAFQEAVNRAHYILGFNSHGFDDRLYTAHGIEIPELKSLDLAKVIWQAAGVPPDTHPKGLGLDAICRANNLPTKTGNAADAPQDFQAGRIGKVIDYCLGDVYSTYRLFKFINCTGGIVDPRDGSTWINVRILP